MNEGRTELDNAPGSVRSLTQPRGIRVGDTATDTGGGRWTAVCALTALTPDRGAAALIDGRQVAVFALSDGTIRAVDNIDPGSGTAVISRGLIGDMGGVATVASPMYKHRFVLDTGRCLDADVPSLAVHPVAVRNGVVFVRLTP